MLSFAALSLSKYVNSTGTDVGFGSLLGVALLALLYFAGARESRTLRDQLEEAHERVTSLEAKLAQALRNQAARVGAQAGQVPSVPGRPGVVPAPNVAVAPMGTALARVQREAGALIASPLSVGVAAALAAPALGSATKLIPSPVPAALPAAVPAIPASATVAGGAGIVAYDADEDYSDEFALAPDDTMLVAAGRSTAAANGRAGGGSGGGVTAPPRVQLYDDESDEVGPVPRRTIPTVDTGPSRSRMFLGRLGGTLAAVVVVAVIVVALLLITSSGGTKHPRTVTQTTARNPVKKKKKKTVFVPADYKISVLNGTGFQGLAGDVGKQLQSVGYKVPTSAVTNDGGAETVETTTVAYRPGFQNAALHVANELHKADAIAIPQTSPATQAEIDNCATPVTSAAAGTCPANVIVTVGNDLQSAANSSN